MARTLLLGLAAAAIPIVSAVAAPATPDEAARLTTLFERYVGQPAPGEPGSVTVVPQGESYVATLDLKRALAGLEGFGITFDPAVSATTLTPLADGTWKVGSTGSPPITAHMGQQTVSLKYATSVFDGIFDPKIAGFSRSRQEQTGSEYTQTTPTLVQNRRVDKASLDFTGTPADAGSVDVKGHYDLAGLAADILLKAAAEPPAGGDAAVPPAARAGTAFSYVVPTSSLDIGLDRFRTRQALDLWAFLVAHPSHDSLVASQDELKALLRAGLPYADGVREASSLAGLAVTTPIGIVSAKALSGDLDLSGLAGTGKATVAFSLADLVVPPGQLPSWSAGLVPKGLDLHIAIDGFHPAEGLAATVDDVDLKKDVIITPDQKAAIGHLFWPGAGTVTLAPSRLTTAVLDLRMEGQAALGPKPAGRVTVTGTGLDKEIAALQAQAATDPGAGQILGPLVLAKNLSKPNPDGSLTWLIEFGDGPVKVNGATLQ